MKMKTAILCSLIVILAVGNIFQLAWNHFAYKLSRDAVPTEEVALEVGKAVLVGVYGESVLRAAPFDVFYDKNRKAWIIIGTLPEGYVGGVPEITVRKSDGRILRIHHGM